MKPKNQISPSVKTSTSSSSQSSLSPSYKSSSIKVSSPQILAKTNVCCNPITASRAIITNFKDLTEYEQDEIILYEKIYYLGEGIKKMNGKYTDKKGDYLEIIGDHLAYRYEIIKLIGKGAFGKVFECIDWETGSKVAIKAIKNKVRFRRAGDFENEILEVLKTLDDSEFMVEKRGSFEFRGHLFIVFELLSINLYQLLESQNFSGLGVSLVKRISVQMLISLKALHSIGIIHCDLKPENVLLKYEGKSSIKLIDFGSACYTNTQMFDYVQSRYYRAPEVLMGCGYNEKIDIWSMGCIIVEMLTGRPLFAASSELNLFHRLVQTIGMPPHTLIVKSKLKNCYFDSRGQMILENNSLVSPHENCLEKILDTNDQKFLDFINGCLRWDPNERMSAEMGLSHAWITGRD